MRQCTITNLRTYLQPLFGSKEGSKQFHWWFSKFVYPLYAMNLHYVKEIHCLNQVETRNLIKTMKKHLFYCAVEEEIKHNPLYVPLLTVTAT